MTDQQLSGSGTYDVNVGGWAETPENQWLSNLLSGNSGPMFRLCSRLLVQPDQRALRMHRPLSPDDRYLPEQED